ncbi:MAG: iron ABC transporter permease [Candidatus Helarchaeota archaeon]|nr:iron ABC transporter permease [Candidatus Helarchaeota archaeon]
MLDSKKLPQTVHTKKIDLESRLDRLLSTKKASKIADGIFLGIFFIFFITPILFIFVFALLNWGAIDAAIFNNFISGSARFTEMLIALLRSLLVGGIVVLIDILIGLPMALILARREFRGKKLLDTLVDLPLAVPTAALGFSIFLFWGSPNGIAPLFGITPNPIEILAGSARGGGLVDEGIIMIILVHVVFTYPYITRNLKVIIQSIDESYEHAARSLGAQKYTVFRTITGPLMKEGLIAGAILAFARSLGETGATLMVYGIDATAPIQIVSLRNLGQFHGAAFLSMILVTISLFLLFLVKVITRRVGLPIQKVWHGFEKFLSKRSLKISRDVIVMLIFFFIIFIPALFIIFYLFTHFTGVEGAFYKVFFELDNKWASIWINLLNSLSIAGIATLFNILIGIPLAFMIVRRNWGKFNSILDTIVDIPLTVPSSALGFSLFLFWGTLGPFGPSGLIKLPNGIFTPGYALICIVHIVFTLPYMVRILVAVITNLEPGYEEASRTLGATSFSTFRKITLPLIKYGLIAGAIMVFTRSLGETGATVVVMGLVRTIPVTIVDWVEALELEAAAFASFILIVLSFFLILILRRVTGKEKQI